MKSMTLFNSYSEAIFNETLEEVQVEKSVDGQQTIYLRYANDTVLIVDLVSSLQTYLDPSW